MDDLTHLTFEQALAELQRTVAALEAGGGDLESSIAHYERGMALIRHCHTLLDRAELRVRMLMPTGEEAAMPAGARGGEAAPEAYPFDFDADREPF
ncbi:MAG: exodeoxyribonuclease VII small subunit [Anaerolineae bacterium]|nr:exodeoxyribonuclease VII small subunit [Caldilineales bacterium]MCX7852395.1 exodeoxyribonuclease VII small subunit [Caldilineales bacterium]MDW8268006.1 exodeoxyribonuclease VII small subunit [Anaerolineae bacterium]